MRWRGLLGLGIFVLVGLSGLSGLLVGLWLQGRYLAINVGESVPIRVFVCQPLDTQTPLQMGTYVAFYPLPTILDELRAIAPTVRVAPGVLWIKQVRAVGGMVVCWTAGGLVVEGTPVATLSVLTAYPLTPRTGCLTLARDEVVVLGVHPRSFDGRYFGPLQRGALAAVCTPLFPWER